MNRDTSSHPTGPNGVPSQIVIWWIIWFGILSALVTVYLVLGRREALVTENPLLGLVALGPLVMSAAVRWLVLPRGARRAAGAAGVRDGTRAGGRLRDARHLPRAGRTGRRSSCSASSA
jgi:hypothetical protein